MVSGVDTNTKEPMMDVKEKVTEFGLSSLSGWELAEYFGCHFTGDTNPLQHGGVFYEVENWERYGYASCVSFADVDGKLLIEAGTINKPDDLANAQRCVGTPDDLMTNIHAQIEATLLYWGFETSEDFGGRYARWFTETGDGGCDDAEWDYRESDNCYFTEDELLESLSGWIKGLTS